jgi:hypothetical protein
MAFTGSAVIKQVADNLVRITGLSLGSNGGSGTIGLHGRISAPDVRLPDGFEPAPYEDPDGSGQVSLQDSIQCWYSLTADPSESAGVAIGIVKTGTTENDFLITMTNYTATEAGDSGALEIYVRFH